VRRGVLALAALLAACGSEGRWRTVAEAEGTTIAVDAAAAREVEEGVFRLWERASLPGRLPWSGEARYALVDYDCVGRRLRLVQFFEAHTPEVEVARVPPTGGWTAVRAGDLGEARLRGACALVRAPRGEG
jgi:hypothetical protein